MTLPADIMEHEGYAVAGDSDVGAWREKFGGVFPAVFSPLTSPIVQSEALGFSGSYDWQNAVWQACWRPYVRVALRTCGESGKSSRVVPCLAASWASAFPGSQVVITSASEDQINEQLWPSLRSVARRCRWTSSAEKVTLTAQDGMPPSVILARVTNQGERFEGYHSKLFEDANGNKRFCPLLLIVDEAKTVSADIVIAAVEQCNPVVVLMCSTTGTSSGEFYDACMNKNGLWTTGWKFNDEYIQFKIPYTQCPHLMVGPVRRAKEALVDKYGENSPQVCSILLAEFFRDELRAIFNDADIANARRAMSGNIAERFGVRRGFCDLAAGGDELTFGVRDGNVVREIEAWKNQRETPATETAERYIRLFKKHGFTEQTAGEISGDNGGVGQLIINQIHAKGWMIGRVNANRAPIHKAGYVDRNSELHFKMREYLENGNLILPRDEVLLEEMKKRQYVKRNSDDNKVRVEPKEEARKKRQESSPNRLDTVVNLCADLEPQIAQARQKALADLRTGSTEKFIKDWREQQESGTNPDSVMGGGWGGDNY